MFSSHNEANWKSISITFLVTGNRTEKIFNLILQSSANYE